MRHLRPVVVAALLALMADPVSAAPAKHHKKVVATPSEAALAKDLIYACGPEAKDLVAYLQDVAHLSPRAARSSVAGLAQGKAGLFKIYRRSNDFADQDADRWIERYDAAEDKRRWAYDVCVARRFSRQLHGAPLLTRLP